MIRPSMLLEALASGIPGIIVNPCTIGEGCHYFPFEPSIEDMVCRTNDILDYAGLTSERLKVIRFPSFEKDYVLNEFSKKVRGLDIPVIQKIPFEGSNRLSRSVKWLSGIEGFDNKEETVGKLAILYLFFHAEGFDILDEMKCSVENIIEKEIKEKDMANLPFNSVLERARIPKSLERDYTIGLVPPSDSGLDSAKVQGLLSQIEGLNIITLQAQEDLDIDKLNSRTKALALELLKEAEENKVDVLVPLSISDLAQLKIFTRGGSWVTTEVSVKDIFSVLHHLNSISGGET
jgi:hypothetical protein